MALAISQRCCEFETAPEKQQLIISGWDQPGRCNSLSNGVLMMTDLSYFYQPAPRQH